MDIDNNLVITFKDRISNIEKGITIAEVSLRDS